MAPGKGPCRRRSSDSGVEPDRGALPRHRDQRTALSQKKKDQRIALFLSDFDQQAKEHIQEMKKELDSLLQTAEKAFAVELLTMPAAVRRMKRKEAFTGKNLTTFPCWINIFFQTDCSLEDMPNPKLVRTNSKKGKFYFPCLANTFLVKVTTIVEYEDTKHSSAKKITKKVSLFSFY
ncbi:BORE2 protein, partial [Picathartes gymnocephalus]|nr:BORE2 protein [Picathartes gymnocephalus]